MFKLAKILVLSATKVLLCTTLASAVEITFDIDSFSESNGDINIGFPAASFTVDATPDVLGSYSYITMSAAGQASQDDSLNGPTSGSFTRNISVTLGGITQTQSESRSYTVTTLFAPTLPSSPFGLDLQSNSSDPLFYNFAGVGTVEFRMPSFFGTGYSDDVRVNHSVLGSPRYLFTPEATPAVPLPATGFLMIGAIAGLIGWKKRRA